MGSPSLTALFRLVSFQGMTKSRMTAIAVIANVPREAVSPSS